MKRRKFKLIVPSILAIFVSVLLIAGTTFALFTSQVTNNLVVSSGKVDLKATLDDLVAYSAKAEGDLLTNEETFGNAGQAEAFGVESNYLYVAANYDSVENIWTFANKGTAQITAEKTLDLDKMTPGDKVTLSLNLSNYSNVDILYRVRLNALNTEASDPKLLEELEVVIDEKVLKGIVSVDEWTLWEVPATTPGEKEIDLAVVLPIDTGNDYQNISVTLRFTVEAVQANAATDEILDKVNKGLKTSSGDNATMYDAYQEAKSILTGLEIDPSKFVVANYLWSPDTDQFYSPYTVEPGFESHFFKAYNQADMPAPADQKYNIYAIGNWEGITEQNPVSIKVGFDAGEATGITYISYVRNQNSDKAQEVIIRTNSANMNLTINAPKDVVHHYGNAGSLTIVAVANASYHENGNVGFLEIKTGRVALEANSAVQQIHLSTTTINENTENEDKVFNNITIAKASSVVMPELSRDPVTIPEKGKLVVELQDSTNEETANSDFIWLTAVGIYEQVAISDNGKKVELTTNEQVQYAAQLTGEAEEVVEKQTAAQQIANNISVGLGEAGTYTVKAEKNEEGAWEYSLQGATQEATAAVAEYTVTVQEVVVETVKTTQVTVVNGQTPVETTTNVENGVTALEKEAAKAEIIEEAIIDEVEDNDDYVARIGTTGYTSLQSALGDGDNKTIIVLKNINDVCLEARGSKTYTIDLNEHTLTLTGSSSNGTQGSAIYVDGGGWVGHTNLSIKNGTLNMPGTGYSSCGIYNYGTLTLKDMTVNSNCNTAIYVNGHDWGSTGTTTLDNVALNSTNASGTAFAAYAFKNSWLSTIYQPVVIIKNSTITGAYNAVAIYGTNATIENCNITATNNNALWISNAPNASGVTGTITVKGNTSLNAGSDYKRLNAQSSNSIEVVEGTYNFNPSNNNSKNYVSDSFIVNDNGNSTWTVVKPTYVIHDDGKVYKDGVLQEYTYSALFGLVENNPLSGLATEGEIIYFTNGRYELGGHYFTQPGVILIGQSRDGVIVSGHYSDNVFTAEGDLTVMNMTIEVAQGACYAITPDIKNHPGYSKTLDLWDCDFVIKNVTFSNTSAGKLTGSGERVFGINVPSRGNVLIENSTFQYLNCAVCGVRDLDGTKTTIKNCVFVDTKEAIGYVANDVLESTVAEWLALNTGLVIYNSELFGGEGPSGNNYAKYYLKNQNADYSDKFYNCLTAY